MGRRRIPYPVRSRFLDQITGIVRANKAALEAGREISGTIDAEADGYRVRDRRIVIDEDDDEFEVDAPDSDRVGRRLRVTAWVLRREGHRGEFVVWHEAGQLRIRRMAT